MHSSYLSGSCYRGAGATGGPEFDEALQEFLRGLQGCSRGVCGKHGVYVEPAAAGPRSVEAPELATGVPRQGCILRKTNNASVPET